MGVDQKTNWDGSLIAIVQGVFPDKRPSIFFLVCWEREVVGFRGEEGINL